MNRPLFVQSAVGALVFCLACGTTAASGGASVADAGAKDIAATDVDAAASDGAAGTDAAAADVAVVTPLPAGDLAGELSDGDVLQGDYTLTGTLTIPAGASVQVLAGTTITSPSFTITVNGTLTVLGTQASPVVISGPATGKAWNGIHVAGTLTASWLEVSYGIINIQSVNANGILTLDHCHVHHGQLYNIVCRGVSNLSRMLVESPRTPADTTYNIGVEGGTLTLEDSTIQDTPNECIICENGGTLYVHYNNLATGHCGIHFNDTASAEVLHNAFTGNQYGMMLMGVAAAEMHGNNFTQSINQEIAEGSTQTAKLNLTGNFWGDNKNFVIQGATPDTSGALSTAATDAGPRPE